MLVFHGFFFGGSCFRDPRGVIMDYVVVHYLFFFYHCFYVHSLLCPICTIFLFIFVLL